MFVLGLGPKKVGALEKFLRHFVLALDRRGYDTVLCFDGTISNAFLKHLDLPFVHIESLNHQGNMGWTCSLKLWRLLQTYKPKVFIYAFHSALRTFPWLARMAGAERIFFNDRSSRPRSERTSPIVPLKRMVARAFTTPITGSISVSDFVKKSATHTGLTSAPNTVILNGVETEEPSPERGLAFREMFGLPKNALVITMACWIVSFKGIDVFLRALEQIVKTNPNVWVAIVGEGEQLEEYRDMAVSLGIADRVVFTGLVINPAKAGVFDAANIFCQPSLWKEAFSFAVAEAMSVEVPIVASNIGGMTEVAREGEAALLFPPGDFTAMRERLLELVNDPELRRRMGKAGRERILKYHRVEDVAERYVQVILGERPQGADA